MSFFKNMLRIAASPFPIRSLFKVSHVPVLLPYQHVVSDEHLSHIKGLYDYKGIQQFEKDLDWLLRNFKPAHPDDVAKAYFDGRPLQQNSFLLSFDDGFREVHDTIAPVLLRKGVPALFFINPDFINNQKLFYRCKLSLIIEKIKADDRVRQEISRYLGVENTLATIRQQLLAIHYPERETADKLGSLAGIDFNEYLSTNKPFLTTDQLHSLARQGFRLGGHSMDHPSYRYLSLNEQLEQTSRSIQFCRPFNATDFEYFAFPHNDEGIGADFFNLMHTAHPACLIFGTRNQQASPYRGMLHRFNAEKPGETMAGKAGSVLLYRCLRPGRKHGR